MKTALFAVLASVAIADDCALSALHETLEVNCKIPGSTTITSECCSGIQNSINQMHQGGGPLSQTQQQQIMHDCHSFQQYVMHQQQQYVMASNPSETLEAQIKAVINALPSGLTCTEAIKGGGESACELQTSIEKLAVTCEIPEETTITSQCCSAIQGGIDMGQAHQALTEQGQQDLMQKCQSFQQYVMQHKPPPAVFRRVLPGISEGTRIAAYDTIVQSLPGGLSCTETINGGDMLSLYAKRTFISAISLAAGVGSKDVSDKASAMPYVLSGIVGFLAGGLVVAGASLRYSKKDRGSNQYILLSA